MDKDKKDSRIVSFIRKALFIDFIKGLHVTFGYFLSPVVTLKYPDEETWLPFRRFRGLHTLNKNEEGKELCVACELCSKACPTDCITVIPMEDDSGVGITDRVARVWKVDLLRCLFCGYCEDACPTTAVRLGRAYELACTDSSSALMSKEELLKPQPVPEAISGGLVVKAKFVRDDKGIKVVADLGRARKRVL